MSFLLNLLCISAALINFVKAQNDTDIEESSTLGSLSSSPRSNKSIIFSCFAVIVICTYKCLHLDIYVDGSHKVKWYHSRLLNKFYWLAKTVAFPEYLVYDAVREYTQAKESVRKAKKIAPKFEWSLAHGFYAQMGGFAIYRDVQVTSSDSDAVPQKAKEDVTLSLIPLEAYARILRKSKSPDTLFVTKESIQDRSKSDALSNLFAISQCLKFAVEMIIRASLQLPISYLELRTAAYIPCAIVVYAFWWHKPFEANHATIIPYKGDRSKLADQFITQEWPILNPDGEKPTPPLPQFVSSVAAAVSSGIHLMAWNWKYPIQETKILVWFDPSSGSTVWRALSLSVTLSSILLGILEMLASTGVSGRFQRSGFLYAIIVVILSPLYTYPMLGLGSLADGSLRFNSTMPAEFYEPTPWVGNWPHFS